MEVIVRTLDKLAKERMTWTGPKGLGIDLGTPVESPAGPTQLTDEQNLPDYHQRVDDIEPKKKKNHNTSSLLKQIPKRVSTLVWTSKTMSLYFPKYSTGLNMVTKNR